MNSLPHRCGYVGYGCGHNTKDCHPERPIAGRIERTYLPGPCPKCAARILQKDMARFAPAIG